MPVRQQSCGGEDVMCNALMFVMHLVVEITDYYEIPVPPFTNMV